MKHLTDEELREKNARLAPHREKAIKAFGEEIFWRLWSIAGRAWLQGLNRRESTITGEHERSAVRVASLVEKARDDAHRMTLKPRPAWSAGRETDFTWLRVHDLLSEAVRLLAKHSRQASEYRRVLSVSAPPNGAGRPSVRSQFVRMALAEHPESCIASPGAWAHLGLAIHLEDEGEDFEELRKAYRDLLPRGKPPHRKVSRARKTHRNR